MTKSQNFLNSKKHRHLEALLELSRTLAEEEDVTKLLTKVLFKAMEITNSEGASIAIVERSQVDGKKGTIPKYEKKLRFYLSTNLSQKIKFTDLTIPLTPESIAGYVATYAQSVRIRDCYTLENTLPYSFNSSFDKTIGYRTKSMLAIPLKTSEGEVLGVLQLVNKFKPQNVYNIDKVKQGEGLPEKSIIAFSSEDESLMEAFCTQSAIAMKNAKLTEDINNQFKSFVKACVTAIERRDPTTSGHSARVAILTVALAKTISKMSSGLFKNFSFTPEQIQEIRVASLLHDFGKIAVPESVLLKAKKLSPDRIIAITEKLQHTKTKFSQEKWKSFAYKENQKNLQETEQDIFGFQAFVDQCRDIMLQLNEPSLMSKEVSIATFKLWIKKIETQSNMEILTEDDFKALSINKGSLSTEEREVMEAHVSDSYKFLHQIKWSEGLQNVPAIAAGHHEKIDGTGYPHKLADQEIPLASKIMAITDMYDSLTSSDRPYKKAVSIEKTLDILKEEAQHQKLDPQLVNVFIEEQVYLATAPRAQRKKAA